MQTMSALPSEEDVSLCFVLITTKDLRFDLVMTVRDLNMIIAAHQIIPYLEWHGSPEAKFV